MTEKTSLKYGNNNNNQHQKNLDIILKIHSWEFY